MFFFHGSWDVSWDVPPQVPWLNCQLAGLCHCGLDHFTSTNWRGEGGELVAWLRPFGSCYMGWPVLNLLWCQAPYPTNTLEHGSANSRNSNTVAELAFGLSGM